MCNDSGINVYDKQWTGKFDFKPIFELTMIISIVNAIGNLFEENGMHTCFYIKNTI